VRGAVDVGGVEQGDAGVERGVDDLAGAVGVQFAAEVVASDADDGDDQARGAQPPVAHLTHDPTLCPIVPSFARGAETFAFIY
jgi:hypothetical protein